MKEKVEQLRRKRNMALSQHRSQGFETPVRFHSWYTNVWENQKEKAITSIQKHIKQALSTSQIDSVWIVLANKLLLKVSPIPLIRTFVIFFETIHARSFLTL